MYTDRINFKLLCCSTNYKGIAVNMQRFLPSYLRTYYKSKFYRLLL